MVREEMISSASAGSSKFTSRWGCVVFKARTMREHRGTHGMDEDDYRSFERRVQEALERKVVRNIRSRLCLSGTTSGLEGLLAMSTR